MTQFLNNSQLSLPELRSNSKAIQNVCYALEFLDSPRIYYVNSGNDVRGWFDISMGMVR